MEAAVCHHPPSTQGQRRGTVSTPPATVQLRCAIWPFMVCQYFVSPYEISTHVYKLQKSMSYPGVSLGPPPEPCFTNCTVGEVIECLINNKLVFPITLDQTAEHPWEDIDSAFHRHLSTHDFDLKRCSGDDSKTFNCLSWDVMTKKKNKDNKLKYQGGTVDLSSFKVDFLSREAIQVNLQNETMNIPFLFLGISPTIIKCFAVSSPNLQPQQNAISKVR